ncbi:helix-turn-helix domain-containing protein [Parasediminibacterium paludis]|uniref:Helix-turn-helix domain-containing protein n=1 Tax=Parasediminibacterium paludis TaxID=908966 RepID=A0ABV8Q1P2_9BACT
MSIIMITIHDLLAVKVEMLHEIRTILSTGVAAVPHRQWLKTWEVKEMLGVSLGTLRNMRKRGDIEYTKLGGLLLYNYQHIMTLIEQNKQQMNPKKCK